MNIRWNRVAFLGILTAAALTLAGIGWGQSGTFATFPYVYEGNPLLPAQPNVPPGQMRAYMTGRATDAPRYTGGPCGVAIYTGHCGIVGPARFFFSSSGPWFGYGSPTSHRVTGSNSQNQSPNMTNDGVGNSATPGGASTGSPQGQHLAAAAGSSASTGRGLATASTPPTETSPAAPSAQQAPRMGASAYVAPAPAHSYLPAARVGLSDSEKARLKAARKGR